MVAWRGCERHFSGEGVEGQTLIFVEFPVFCVCVNLWVGRGLGCYGAAWYIL